MYEECPRARVELGCEYAMLDEAAPQMANSSDSSHGGTWWRWTRKRCSKRADEAEIS